MLSELYLHSEKLGLRLCNSLVLELSRVRNDYYNMCHMIFSLYFIASSFICLFSLRFSCREFKNRKWFPNLFWCPDTREGRNTLPCWREVRQVDHHTRGRRFDPCWL